MISFGRQLPLRAGYICSGRARKSGLCEMLHQDGIILDKPKLFNVFLKHGPTKIRNYDIIFIDLVGLEGVRDVVGALISLRVEYPSLPVVLISNSFVADDFGTSRRAIGDVSLSSPILASSLVLGCRQAFLNNLKFQESLSNILLEDVA